MIGSCMEDMTQISTDINNDIVFIFDKSGEINEYYSCRPGCRPRFFLRPDRVCFEAFKRLKLIRAVRESYRQKGRRS